MNEFECFVILGLGSNSKSLFISFIFSFTFIFLLHFEKVYIVYEMEHFDLDYLVGIILNRSFKHVTLQFPDELLKYAISVFTFIRKSLPLDVAIYIAADSTYGSSVDDVSAMHIDGDVLVYFGNDLSSSGSIPVILMPEKKYIDIGIFVEQIISSSTAVDSLLLICDACYYHLLHTIKEKSTINIIIPDINNTNNLNQNQTINSLITNDTNVDLQNELYIKIGGFYILNTIINDITIPIWYIGEQIDESQQLSSIILRLPNHFVTIFNPLNNQINIIKGINTKLFNERYGGIAKVKDAKVIGIIIGSMGLTTENIQNIIERLNILIKTAKKKSQIFIMGRLNEAKLCNFMEIDIYCLISNENVSIIKPKTFHVPIVTPFELEIGLNARNWESIYNMNINSIINDNIYTINYCIQNIKDNLSENSENESENENESKDLNGIVSIEKIENNNQTIIKINNEKQLINKIDNILIDRFKSREYHGLNPLLQNEDLSIQSGTFGTSVSYTVNNANENN